MVSIGPRISYSPPTVQPFLLAGSILWIAGILGSAFSTKLWHFFLTQVCLARFERGHGTHYYLLTSPYAGSSTGLVMCYHISDCGTSISIYGFLSRFSTLAMELMRSERSLCLLNGFSEEGLWRSGSLLLDLLLVSSQGFHLAHTSSIPMTWISGSADSSVIVHIAGGAIGTLLVQIMLTRMGQRKTLAIYSCIDLAALTIALLLVKERRRPGSRRAPIIWFDKTFLADPVFWSLGACLLVTVLCVADFIMPNLFVPNDCYQWVPNPNILLACIHKGESA